MAGTFQLLAIVHLLLLCSMLDEATALGARAQASAAIDKESMDVSFFDVRMPGSSPTSDDAYINHYQSVSFKRDVYVTKMEPLGIIADIVHHMLVSLCPNRCSFIFAWAKNSPALSLPNGVAFRIPAGSSILLNTHYKHAFGTFGMQDHSGIRFHLAPKGYKPRFLAAILFMANNGLFIPPRKNRVYFDAYCQMTGFRKPFYIFAVRGHAHSLGSVLSGYKLVDGGKKTARLEEFVKRNPQWPQGFFPLPEPYPVHPNDVLVARCVYNSSTRGYATRVGATDSDEMCNMYLMYYVKASEGDMTPWCGPAGKTPPVPDSSFVPLERNETLETLAAHHPSPAKELDHAYPTISKMNSTGASQVDEGDVSADDEDDHD